MELNPILNLLLNPWKLTMIIIVEDNIVFYLMQFFSKVSDARNSQVIFAEKPQMKINSFGKQNGYLIQTWSDKAFKSIVVNQTCQSIIGHFRLRIQSL